MEIRRDTQWSRLARASLRLLFISVAFLVVAALSNGAHAQSQPTYTVTSTADTAGSCPANNNPLTQPCTLRQALTAINNAQSGATSLVIFNIPGAGTHVISPATQLVVTSYFQIDGATDPDGDVILDGGGRDIDGLLVDGSLAFDGIGGGVDGLTIRNFGRSGILYYRQYVAGPMVFSNLTIENNLGHGIELVATNQVTIRGSLIRGNDLDGVHFGVYEGDGANRITDGTVENNTIEDNAGNGVTLQWTNNVYVHNNIVRSNDLDGIEIFGGTMGGTVEYSASFNIARGNVITLNGGDGISLYDTTNTSSISWSNRFTENVILANGDQAVDLNDDGRSANDRDDADDGANYTLNTPVIVRAVTTGTTSYIDAYLETYSYAQVYVEFLASTQCNAGAGQMLSTDITSLSTGVDGRLYFRATVTSPVPLGYAVRAMNIEQEGGSSEFSDCAIFGAGNDSWPLALSLDIPSGAVAASPDGSVSVSQYLDAFGQSRWYRFKVLPHSQLIVTLTNLPDNYDLTLYKDILAEYNKIASPDTIEDLTKLQAEVAPSAFAPSAFAPSAFAPSAFAPSAFAPSAFAPSAFAPSAFAPSAFAPSAFAPSSFSPDAYAPSSYSPWAFEPMAFESSSFDPSAYRPATFDPAAFTGAQTRSLLGVSAFEGVSEEGLLMNTWLNDGEFYVRVRGRDGVFNVLQPFTLTIHLFPIPCSTAFEQPLPPTSLVPNAGNYSSIILYDGSRMTQVYGAPKTNALLAKLDTLRQRPEVNGVLVDVSQDARVAAANARADQFAPCPYGKNVVAESIKSIVDGYRSLNGNMQYVVVVGGDNMVPFYRYPDNALLGPESDYVPPVLDPTASQASLRLNYVLSQDFYGSTDMLSLNGTELPIPDLAVGRLVENPDDIIKYLDAYLLTANGVAPAPTSAFVTGYDFVADVANAVKSELATGLGGGATVNSLITPREVAPADPLSWSAFDLDNALDARRYDLVFLAGHFAANNALAADFETGYLTTDLVNSPTDFKNSLFFSIGCHSGYNIVNEHGIPGITVEPDWASAFAQKGVTWIGGTGYQYGDTEFIEYGERLYLDFTRMLRVGAGPVPVGKALVRAKQRYISQTAELKGIHEKTVLQPTLYGLPMFSINLPSGRMNLTGRSKYLASTPPVVSGLPGAALDMRSTDIVLSPVVTEVVRTLVNADTNQPVAVSYLRGKDGVLTRPTEPTLPIEGFNLSVDDMVLRGVGWRGGLYCDTQNIIPLTGAPTTDIRGVHTPFYSNVWFPLQPWSVNYYDAFGSAPGSWGSRLYVMPAQHRSMSPGSVASVRRQWNQLRFRLYYSDYTETQPDGSEPALSDAPTIVNASAATDLGNPNLVNFLVRVVGNPSAGVHSVWIVYTTDTAACGEWKVLDLGQLSTDTTKWVGQLAANGNNLRYVALAVNGVGVVGISNNMGAYYGGQPAPASRTPTNLALQVPASGTGAFGTSVALSAILKDGSGNPLSGKPVTIAIGAQQQQAITDGSGRAQVNLPLLLQPGDYRIRAWFLGDATYAPSAKNSADRFKVTQQSSVITIEEAPVAATAMASSQLLITLTDASGKRLLQQTVFFVVTINGVPRKFTLTTNQVGEAKTQAYTVPAAPYTVSVEYKGSDAYVGTTTTTTFNSAPQPVRLPVIRKNHR